MSNLASEMIFCGIGHHERVLHFGALDNDLNFIEALDEYELDIEYTAIDPEERIKTFFTEKQPMERTHNWVSHQSTIQEFLDELEDSDYRPNLYNWVLVTGVFDKPIYSERQYQFIDSIVEKCAFFGENVVFTIKEIPTPTFKYSMVYLFSHFTVKYNKVNVKKIAENEYIFHITK